MPKQNQKNRKILISGMLLLFFALAGSASAATYYVDATNGNDSWIGTAGVRSGTTSTGPWKTVGKVNGFNFQTGDDVYFKCGEIWKDAQLNIDWSGSASNRSLIGAYYLSGSAPVIGVSGKRPVFDGDRNSNGAIDDADLPTGTYYQYSGLIGAQTDGAGYLDVYGLEIRNSRALGISIAYADNYTVKNCVIHNINETAVVLEHGANNGLVEDCDIYHHNMRHPNGTNRPWGAGIVVVSNRAETHDVVLRKLKVHDGYGEGIDFGRNTRNITVEYCEVYDNYAMGIYSDTSSNGIIRHNLVYGTGDKTFCTRFGSGYCPWGITIANEVDSATYGDNWEIYGNFIANTTHGLAIWGKTDGSCNKGVKFYNNTVVEPLSADGTQNSLSIRGTCTDTIIKNNIFMQSSGTSIADVPAGLAIDYNFWSKQPETDARGAHDPVYGNPLLVKSSGWNGLTEGSIAPADFKLQSSSPAINRGVALASDYNRDYWNTLRPQGAGWDIGAHEYPAGDTTAPMIPSGLQVR